MNIGTLRRRTRHVDVGGYKYERIDSAESEDLQEPLLGQSSDDFHRSRNFDDDDDDWEGKTHAAQIVWSQMFTRLLAQWAQFFAALFAHGSWPGSMLFWSVGRQSEYDQSSIDLHLTPIQEERLEVLQRRLEIPFDGASPEHQDTMML